MTNWNGALRHFSRVMHVTMQKDLWYAETYMPRYYVFTTPENTICQLLHDSGWNGISVPTDSPEGRAGQVFDIPSSVPNANGAELRISAEGYIFPPIRGVLKWDESNRAYLQCDDFHLTAIPEEPEVPVPPDGPADTEPETIINWVASQPGTNLSTHEGCGKFTEDCCRNLHELNDAMWGHIAKNPGQNQYNGHAVDAVQCLAGPHYGVWDIIHDSVSPNASPQFINKGPAEPTLWYYPANEASRTYYAKMRKDPDWEGKKR